jgi:hypothetical protein
MASFEIVVRPVVFPDIRPQAPRVLPREDDPEKGIAKINGNPAKSFGMSYNYSFNASSSSSTEVERDVDEARVYQKDKDGKINKDNFVDVQVAKKIRKKGYNGDDWSPTKDPSAAGATQPKRKTRWENKYKPIEAEDNIEIKEQDKKITNPDEQ